MVGILISFWEGLISGAMLVSGSVTIFFLGGDDSWFDLTFFLNGQMVETIRLTLDSDSYMIYVELIS